MVKVNICKIVLFLKEILPSRTAFSQISHRLVVSKYIFEFVSQVYSLFLQQKQLVLVERRCEDFRPCVVFACFVFACGMETEPRLAFLKANHYLSLHQESLDLADKSHLYKEAFVTFGVKDCSQKNMVQFRSATSMIQGLEERAQWSKLNRPRILLRHPLILMLFPGPSVPFVQINTWDSSKYYYLFTLHFKNFEIISNAQKSCKCSTNSISFLDPFLFSKLST